jgi:glycosyltransferase involved in cell wall biosynthesis
MTVIFVYHEIQNYGAGAALHSLERYHRLQGIPTALVYLYDIKDLSFLNKYPNPVVVCNTIISYPLVQALSNTNVPTYWYIHEWNDEKHDWMKHFNPNIFTSKIMPIFVCQKSYENYKEKIPYLNNYMIMYNSIPIDVLVVKTTQFKVNKRDCLTIAMIGSVEDRKNQQAFIDNVFYKLTQPVHLLLVGRIMKPLTIKAEFQNQITITNHVENAVPYIMSADIIVSYSLNEVMPMHIIESFYCKKPVISTNVGGISEMIDNTNGFLIEPNDAETCYQRINELNDFNTREKIGENAYNTYLNKFNSSCKLLI